MSNTTLTREQLYERLWAEPATKIAASLGLSSVALGKIARQMDVPAPPRGYWAKKAAGKRVSQPRLPRRRDETPLRYTFHATTSGSEVPEDVQLHVARAQFKNVAMLVVPDVVEALHPLLIKRRGGKAGSVNARVAIQVETKETHARAVRVMHVILTELDRVGLRYVAKAGEHAPERWKRTPPCIEIDVHGEPVQFSISEWIRDFWEDDPERKQSLVERIRSVGWSKRVRAGDGKLRLQVGSGHYDVRTWRDDDRGLVETKLPAVFRAFFAVALAARELRRTQEEHARERKQAERVRKRAEAIQRQGELLRADVLRRVEVLLLAERVREVVERVRAASRDEDAAWITWAMGHAARLDLQVVDALPSMTVATDDEEEHPADDDE